ncbi:indole-3-glycerol phosphate synthase TrpC [Wenzhouxiangella limi]|uniref:Indole-3-glycerol phosphate synthase n=1 Tax=Wenzhouxiangella limi TaxID=2707351 RepID=A0A845UX78_9GAMM|nr:indole-3-glycerol phosphate synthase TrpC [Wenzhouxiangella limi]
MSEDILARILAVKRQEIAFGKASRGLDELQAFCADLPSARDFAGALKRRAGASCDAVIAEIKRASPSAGLIRADFDPAAIARSYEAGGASCLSVLTDEQFFQGHADFLAQARAACRLPVLRKDFIIDPWQVWETRALGADALLLIVAALDDTTLAELSALGRELGLSVLVEVHDQAELDRALAVPGDLVGINNRDLHRFVTELETTLRLAPQVPDNRLVISESGIHTRADIARLRAGGIGAFLIGESFMRQSDPGAALAQLLG